MKIFKQLWKGHIPIKKLFYCYWLLGGFLISGILAIYPLIFWLIHYFSQWTYTLIVLWVIPYLDFVITFAIPVFAVHSAVLFIPIYRSAQKQNKNTSILYPLIVGLINILLVIYLSRNFERICEYLYRNY